MFLIASGFVAAIGIGGYLMVGSRRWLWAYTLLVVIAVILGVIESLGGDKRILWAGVSNELINILTHLLTIYIALRFALFASGLHPVDRILGGITGYILLGLTWANVYKLILLFDPMAISGTAADGGMAGDNEILYYSFITLATQGYGEIVPVNSWARTAAIFEGVVGTLYLGILVATLVSGIRPPAVDREGKSS